MQAIESVNWNLFKFPFVIFGVGFDTFIWYIMKFVWKRKERERWGGRWNRLVFSIKEIFEILVFEVTVFRFMLISGYFGFDFTPFERMHAYVGMFAKINTQNIAKIK